MAMFLSLALDVFAPLQLPIEIAYYDRLTTNNLDCDQAGGVFTRDRGFTFEIYFDDDPSKHTYKDTRIREMYIKHEDIIQWSWAGFPLNKDPDWEYGKLLLADLLEGIAFTATQRPLADAPERTFEYCLLRIDRLGKELARIGVNPGVFEQALKEAAEG